MSAGTMTNLMHGDCLELMKRIPDKSIDMVLCDLPYGTTSCKWDSVIPFEPLWEQYKRITKDNSAIVLFGNEPFSSALRMSNSKMYKYDWIWVKNTVTGFVNSKRQPLKNTENISVFYKNLPCYNAQGLIRVNKVHKNSISTGGETLRKDIAQSKNKGSLRTQGKEFVQEFSNYPRTTLSFKKDNTYIHPTQKPIALLEYLIKTYTNMGGVVLDNTMGSGSTGVACINTGRSFIGIEKDDKYFEIARNRIAEAKKEMQSMLDLGA